MAVSAKPELISHLCVARDEKVGVFGFVFFRDGEWIHEVVDDKLYLQVGDDDDVKVVRDWCNTRKTELSLAHDEEKLKNTLQRGGKALYFSYCKSDETWLPLIEKAYAKAHGDYYAIEGGHPSEGIEDLTGGVADTVRPGDIMDKDRFWIEQLSQVNEKYLFGGSTKSKDAKGIASNHAYAVLQAWEEGELRLLELRNPWGKQGWEGDWSDGSKLWTPEMMRKLDYTFGDDGVFWISYADFLAHFRSINRVRLLDKSWQVAQTWTSVNVPWTVDYLDTKFLFTIDKNCSVVVVLSQPDDRYWLGLRGRFLFSMHFRVVKEGEDEVQWVVRSMRNSGGETTSTRSVSAEIEDLEPGAYAVLVKVTATRASEVTTGQEAIFKHAHDRKEKLLHVGRRYDYAHSKGDLRGLEEANQRQAKQEKRDQDIERKKSARKHNQQEKERKRKCKKRIDDAKKAKRREFETKQREKAKSRKLRAETKGAEKDEHASGDGEESLRSWEKEKDKGTCAEGDDAKDGAEEANDEGNDADAQGQRTTSAGQGITERITKLLARRASDSGTGSSRRDSVFPVVHDHDDDDDDEEHSDASSQSPSDPPEDLDDDDFSWNSEM